MGTFYEIGNVQVLLEEVAAIGQIHRHSMSQTFLDIYLKGNAGKIVTTFDATENERKWPNGERRGYADLCSNDYVVRVESEIDQFRQCFKKLNTIT